MAPLKQPSQLRQLALSHVASLVEMSCTQLYLHHGSMDTKECYEATMDLHNFFTNTLTFDVMDELINLEPKQSTNNQLLLTPLSLQLWWSRDPRIRMTLLMHPMLTRLNVDSNKRNGGYCLLDEVDEERFLLHHLPRLNNLVDLTLNLCASDTILIAVAANCRQLQCIDISSRIESDLQIRSVRPTLIVSNGYRITDAGLLKLLSCRLLRRISINRMFSVTGSRSKSVSLETLNTLLLNLPELRSINCPCIGEVLNFKRPNKCLKIAKFIETEPEFVDIEQLQSICPSIEHFVVAMPLAFPSTHTEPQIDFNAARRIMKGLSTSPWCLSALELVNFPWDSSFSSFLSSKGRSITSLHLRPWPTRVPAESIIELGKWCPNLRSLGLSDVNFDVTLHQSGPGSLVYRKGNLYSKLINLEMSGRQWNPNQVLPPLLNSAQQLQSLVLRNSCNTIGEQLDLYVDGVLINALETHGFCDLKSLHLDHGCAISMSCARRLISCCPMISRLGLWLHDHLIESDVVVLKEEMRRNNIDIRIDVFEINYFTM